MTVICITCFNLIKLKFSQSFLNYCKKCRVNTGTGWDLAHQLLL